MSDILASTMAQYVPAAAGQMAQGGLGILSGYMNYLYNRSLASQQNEYNLEMWKMTNEYNSPQAQMQRFKDAGLNPNLIYGQGNNGNASSAPQMVVPNAPDISKGMQEIAKAFNIENLRTTIANRKKAEEEAKQEKYRALDMRDEREALTRMGDLYNYDMNTGRYEYIPSRVVVGDYSKSMGENSTLNGRFNRMMAENAYRTYLLPYRSALLEQQKNYLVPQVSMANYESKYYPVSYWIGTGAKAAKGIGDIVGIFNPVKSGFKRQPITYHNTYNKIYY